MTSFSSHRPFDSIVTSLDDNLRPPTDAGHPSEQAVWVDQLVAIHQLVGTAHSWPQPGIRLILHIGERHLEKNNTIIII